MSKWTKQEWCSAMLMLMRVVDHTEEYGECVVWTGYKQSNGFPQIKIDGKAKLVRRVVFESCGDSLKTKEPVAMKCGERSCVNRSHMFRSSSQAIAKKAAANGAFSTLARRSKIAATKRKSSKLTMEQAREIRLSSEKSKDLAKAYGVDKSLINKIKRNVAWVEFTSPFSGLFTGLMAANDGGRKRA